MKIRIVCVGKTREPFIREGMQKYVRYLKPYGGVEIRELKEERIPDIRDAPAVRRREAERIDATVSGDSYMVALDERGEAHTSHEFAGFLNNAVESGVREMVFVVGGALGLDETVTSRARKVLAMSRWTMTHEMARLVLLEQLYRAYTIITGKRYHY